MPAGWAVWGGVLGDRAGERGWHEAGSQVMKTVLPRQEFQEALTAAAALAGGRTTRPILGCVRLVAGEEGVEVSASDGEAGLRVRAPVLSVGEGGEAVVPADRLLPIVRELEDVEISLEADERCCMIRGAGSEFRVFVMSPADFPPVELFEGEADLVIDGAQLRRMVALTVYAAARESSRYAINGVLWEKRGRQLFLVATDGRRLARAGGSVSGGGGDFDVIVPAKAMAVFEKVFGTVARQDGWTVDVKVMPSQMLLRSGDRQLATVLVEGHFPKYEDVIPKGHKRRARAGREALASAVRRAALLTTEESRAVRLNFAKDLLVITSQAPERGDARVELPIGYEGEPLEVGFNPAFLSDALRAMPFEEVLIDLEEAYRPGVLSGEDRNDFLYVVMPVSLSG